MISNFELPSESKIWENKKSQEFRDWIKEQALLPAEKWNEDFRNYVELKYEESLEKEEDESREEIMQKTWERYLNGLDFSEKDLKDKRIIDLGCGEGEFVRECLSRGISQEVYGLDLKTEEEVKDLEEQGHFFTGDFEKELPLKNLDYILSVGAVSLGIDKETAKGKEQTLRHALDAINKDGQIRIFPINKVGEHSQLEGIKDSEKVLKDILEKIKKDYDIEYELRPIDIRVSGIDKDVWLEQVLIIKYKK
jgi:SAM-dependent methyltransferase